MDQETFQNWNQEKKKLETADTWIRFFAMWIDILILIVICMIIRVEATSLIWFLFESSIVLFISSLYFILFRYYFSATPWKLAFWIKIVSQDDSQISIQTVILRYIWYLVSLFCFWIGFIWILLDEKKQWRHDKIALTKVVNQ